MESKDGFSSKIGYVLAAAGSAVGLGNIWRFPYLAAQYGGGIFLFTYLILVLTFGYALLISENCIGRMTGFLTRLAEGRHEHGGQNGDDTDDDQQFNQCESFLCFHGVFDFLLMIFKKLIKTIA